MFDTFAEKKFLLKELVKKNKLQKEVIFCGKVTDRDLLANYFARADLFLFPSLYDASSIVQIEAASVEDRCKDICFNVFIYNVEDGVSIDYSNGDSSLKN